MKWLRRLRRVSVAWFLAGLVVGVSATLVATRSITNTLVISAPQTFTIQLMTSTSTNCSTSSFGSSIDLGIINRGQATTYLWCVKNTGNTAVFYRTGAVGSPWSFNQPTSSDAGFGCSTFGNTKSLGNCVETDETCGTTYQINPGVTLLTGCPNIPGTRIRLSVLSGAAGGTVTWTDTIKVFKENAGTNLATTVTYTVTVTVQ